MPYEVTIGIPVYQVEKYLRQTIDSALSQTFADIEFVFCDDCSTDGSMSIVEEYQKSHSRGGDIKILRQPHHGGVGMARNRILSEASGKYIYFMDSDDTIEADAIELLHGHAVRHDADVVFGSMRRILVYDKGQEELMQYPSLIFQSEEEFADFAFQSYRQLMATTCNFLIKREIYVKNRLRYQPINYWEDFMFTLDLPAFVSRVVLLPDITYTYYCRSGSSSNYQQRPLIEKSEILNAMRGIISNKESSFLVSDKPYFPNRMYKLMVSCFYVECKILSNRGKIRPPFTLLELRDFMRYPIPFSTVWTFKKWRLRHLLLYAMGVLPPLPSILLMWTIGKLRRLI